MRDQDDLETNISWEITIDKQFREVTFKHMCGDSITFSEIARIGGVIVLLQEHLDVLCQTDGSNEDEETAKANNFVRRMREYQEKINTGEVEYPPVAEKDN